MEAELKALKQCEVIIARLNFSIVHYMFAVFEKQRKKIYIYDLLHSTQSRSTYFKREIAGEQDERSGLYYRQRPRIAVFELF